MDLEGYRLVHIKDSNTYEILKEKRVVLGMTQQQVADKAGIRLQQYQKFESGEHNIKTASFQLACRVIEALGMNVSDFFHGEYSIGEEVYLENGILKYEKTMRDVNEDV